MHQLKAEARQELGKKVKQLRQKGMMPAVLYGEGVPSQSIAIQYREFERGYKEAGESTLLTLEYEGKPYPVLIHDIAYDPIKSSPIHADFYAVRMDKEIRTKVSLAFIGESPAVENEGGVLIKAVQELEVEALPANLPHELIVDLSLLTALESHLTVKDILVPQGVRILAELDEVVAVVESPRTSEELAALAQTPEAPAVAEVQTEQEAKRAAQEKPETEENGETKSEK